MNKKPLTEGTRIRSALGIQNVEYEPPTPPPGRILKEGENPRNNMNKKIKEVTAFKTTDGLIYVEKILAEKKQAMIDNKHSMLENLKSKANEYNDLVDDRERLLFLQKNNEFCVELDNDCTMVCFNRTEDMGGDDWDTFIHEYYLNSFDDYHGTSDGNLLLFELLGIDADFC
jgi:hypothetical protein